MGESDVCPPVPVMSGKDVMGSLNMASHNEKQTGTELNLDLSKRVLLE